MCGIAGIAYFNSKKQVRREELSLMSEKISHRGPDDEGIYLSTNKNVGLVSRRLAIIDLSKKGHMPMRYGDRYVITYNGEVYNFKEEKNKLEKLGYKFNSNSDTEVILALYSKYKTRCLKHLRGMFAFVIYDKVENTLFMARDRIGKKPLKYLLDDNKLIFASELKAILALGSITPQVDAIAIQKYLLYGYTPAPLTGFTGIKKLEPATYMLINLNNKSVIKRRYWQMRFNKKLNLSEKSWTKKILDTLEESTKLRMISDVPIGAFLSGGVDSSAVVAMMARNSLKKIQTFTIIHENKDFNEKKYADNIVKLYNTKHHEILIKPSKIDILPEIARSYEEPFADASSLVTFMVSQKTSKYVKVALNGDGGDENFAGYGNRYQRLKRDINFRHIINFAKKIRGRKTFPIYGSFSEYARIFHSNDYELEKKLYDDFTGSDLKDAGLKFDLMYFLPDQLLAKVDIASMRYGLESRSPLLDQKMIELSCQIPFRLKVKNGETKYIFKKALESLVPKENLYRKKVGFGIPLSEWFKGDLNPYAKKLLLSKNSMIKDYFDSEKIKPMILSKNKTEDFGPRIWSLMMLELWLQSYFS